ncbi:MAG TPA: hypothetical protein VFZ16_16385 [Hyphomicrobiaceae bacterium]|nr:hypothetical protein [Hyphomicrobiaceae bacterium]
MTSFRHVLDSNISIKLLSAKTPPAVREAMRPRLEQASGLLCISSIMLPASTARANVASGRGAYHSSRATNCEARVDGSAHQ